MQQLTELNSETHRYYRVVANSAILFAAEQHVLHIRASEVGKAISCFPVFGSRSASTGDWALSAMTSLLPGGNLFIKDGAWTATYEPDCTRSYPLYLMQSPGDSKSYVVGIDESSSALSEASGERLFDDDGNDSIRLNATRALLEANVQNDIQTHFFLQRIEGLELFKSINVNVHFEDDSVQTITGLHTVDEDKLKALTLAVLEELNKKGYLMLAHAMLLSIAQLNLLIRKHNQVAGNQTVKQVKLAIARDVAASEPGL